MDWIQVVVILISLIGNLGANFSMFLWNRSESNADRRDFHAGLTSHREEIKISIA